LECERSKLQSNRLPLLGGSTIEIAEWTYLQKGWTNAKIGANRKLSKTLVDIVAIKAPQQDLSTLNGRKRV